MPVLLLRPAAPRDVPGLAAIRAAEWGGEDFWRLRLTGYLNCEHNPQQALRPRVIFVALEDNVSVGFVAGHLTQRCGCDGELQWINVVSGRRSSGIASALLRRLATWFVEHEAQRVCVDADPGNIPARRFYARHGAKDLNKHWMVWSNVKTALDGPPA